MLSKNKKNLSTLFVFVIIIINVIATKTSNLHRVDFKKRIPNHEFVQSVLFSLKKSNVDTNIASINMVPPFQFRQREMVHIQKHNNNTVTTKKTIHFEILKSYGQTQYLAHAQVGNPKQTFEMIYDTGSSNLWFPSNNCWFWSCTGKNKYKRQDSKTYVSPAGEERKPFEVSYASGTVKGFFAIDDIHIGGITIKAQEFAEVDNADALGIMYKLGKFDGIVGMGFDELSRYNITTPFHQMIIDKLVEDPIFAFYLGDSKGGYGEITFGGIDPSHYKGEINWVKTTDPLYWAIKNNEMLIDGDRLLDMDAKKAVIDSGTSLLVGSSTDVARIMKKIQGVQAFDQAGQTLYATKCNNPKLPVFTWNLNGNKFDLEPEDYLMKSGMLDENGYMICLIAMSGLKMPPQIEAFWILGDVFMRKYYTAFNFEKRSIGFAIAA